MSDDIGERWLTYRELAAELRCTSNAARMFAHRRGWRKRAANRIGDPVHVLVPENAVVQARAMHGAPAINAQENGAEHPHGFAARALELLAAQLEHERTRANDAIAAERVSANRVLALQHEIDRRREWSFIRRLRWAIRPGSPLGR